MLTPAGFGRFQKDVYLCSVISGGDESQGGKSRHEVLCSLKRQAKAPAHDKWHS